MTTTQKHDPLTPDQGTMLAVIVDSFEAREYGDRDHILPEELVLTPGQARWFADVAAAGYRVVTASGRGDGTWRCIVATGRYVDGQYGRRWDTYTCEVTARGNVRNVPDHR